MYHIPLQAVQQWSGFRADALSSAMSPRRAWIFSNLITSKGHRISKTGLDYSELTTDLENEVISQSGAHLKKRKKIGSVSKRKGEIDVRRETDILVYSLSVVHTQILTMT